MSEQRELRFDDGPEADGFAPWQAARARAAHALAIRLGLPLNHPCAVWLRGDIRLREEVFFPEAERADAFQAVEALVFNAGEIESCVRLD